MKRVLLALLFAAVAFPQPTRIESHIIERLKGFRDVPDDRRPAVAEDLAEAIAQLPPDELKVKLAFGLANLSTEGDFGRNTLEVVAKTLAGALKEQPEQQQDVYLGLAQLIRYEHVKLDWDSPKLKAALAELESEDRDRQNANFTLKGLDGHQWTLKDLKGKVVVVNFWATWCPPCRKEMPDLNALYRTYSKRGLITLGITNEDAATVTEFLRDNPTSYPILVDPGGQTAKAFHVESIPHTFVYDKSGKLAAQAIDMRTRKQFLEMLSAAGLGK